MAPGFLHLCLWSREPSAFREPFDLMLAKVVASQAPSFLLLVQRLEGLNSFILGRASVPAVSDPLLVPVATAVSDGGLCFPHP